MEIFLVLIAIAVLLGIFVWLTYNRLVRLNERVSEAWSDITVQLKYRADLLPNLVETVKGYAKHEKELLASITEARSASMNAKTPKTAAAAENMMQGLMTQVLAVAENYPELKANEGFVKLQDQLQDVEDKIQAARRFYNNGAQELNTQIKVFPVNIFKGFGFKTREYFEVSEQEQAKIENTPEVKF